MSNFQKVRRKKSDFAYRDSSCPAKLRTAFKSDVDPKTKLKFWSIYNLDNNFSVILFSQKLLLYKELNKKLSVFQTIFQLLKINVMLKKANKF